MEMYILRVLEAGSSRLGQKHAQVLVRVPFWFFGGHPLAVCSQNTGGGWQRVRETDEGRVYAGRRFWSSEWPDMYTC